MALSGDREINWPSILPISVEVNGIRIEFLSVRHGLSPRDKLAKSGRECVVYDAVWHVPTCEPKKFSAGLRRTLASTPLDATTWVRIVHEAFNWAVHTFDLGPSVNHWAPPLTTRQAARRLFGLDPDATGKAARMQPDGKTPDLPGEITAVAARDGLASAEVATRARLGQG